MVSKTWAKEAVRFAPEDDLSIGLVLSCDISSPKQQQEREVERLASLETWLLQYGHLMGAFDIHTHAENVNPNEHMLARSQAVPGILDALAAAGRRSGGLPLQQLRVPPLGNTLLPTITQALSGCRQLRCLQLDYSYGGEDIRASRSVLDRMATALQQLTQLTSLKLDAALDLYYPHRVHQNLGGLFQCLPSSLVVLEVGRCPKQETYTASNWEISTDNLQHLVSLQQLCLPDNMLVTSSSEGNPLAQLTALTRLQYGCAMLARGEALLALPNLVELVAGWAQPRCLDTLASSKPTLRALTCCLDKAHVLNGAATVADLTQLTHLSLSSGHTPHDSSWGPSEGELLGGALSFLVGLRSLSVRAEVLQQVDVACLTALSRLEVHMPAVMDRQSDLESIREAVTGLVTAHGRLQQVVLVGVPPSDHDEFRAAIGAAAGQASLVFL
jgi:hypothetical protein